MLRLPYDQAVKSCPCALSPLILKTIFFEDQETRFERTERGQLCYSQKV